MRGPCQSANWKLSTNRLSVSEGKEKGAGGPAWMGAVGIPTLTVRHGGGSNRRSAGEGCAYPGH